MKDLFLLDRNWTFVNHGAFGAPFSLIVDIAQRWRVYTERQPLRFIDRELFPRVVGVIKKFASFLNCRPEDLVLLQNATTGLNCILQSFPLSAQDKVLFFDCTYASVKKMIRKVCKDKNAVPVEAKLKLKEMKGSEDILAQVEAAIPEGCKLVVIDHVTSNEALLFPIDELVEICHKKDALVLIDGAHGLGSCPLDLERTGADFYVGNCHKWFCAPRGVAFLHVNHSNLSKMSPVRGAIVSHGYEEGFASEFIWDGARDYSSWFALDSCLLAWEQLDLSACRAYSKKLLDWAGHMLGE
ncbi:hypothetical protein GUITHDRAFT_83567, partial [Guillardia theta CCMP2712]